MTVESMACRGPRPDAAAALVKVAGVLVEDRGQDGSADEATDNDIAEVGAVTPRVAVDAVAVAGMSAAGLLDAGDDAGGDEVDGVRGGAQREVELMLRLEWRGVPEVAGVEVGEYAEGALLDLGVDLLGGDLVFGDCDADVRGGGGDG